MTLFDSVTYYPNNFCFYNVGTIKQVQIRIMTFSIDVYESVQGIYQEKNVYYLSFLHVPHAPSLVFHFYYKWEQMKTKLSHSSDMSDTLFCDA